MLETLEKYLQPLLGDQWAQVLWAFVALSVIIGVVFLLLPPGFIYIERRIAGWVQSRIGPNRVGPFGLLQLMADGLKMVVKEDIIPAAADGVLFRMAPYLILAGATGAAVILPFGPQWIGSELELGLLWYLAAGSFVTLGIVMAGWASNNKWSLLGAARSAAQVVSYEIAVGLALLPAVFLAGTFQLQNVIGQQGWMPQQWNVFHNPGMFLCLFFYFIAGLAEINRTPFDLPEAESELVSGYNTEYSSLRWGLFMLAEYADIYIISAITAAVFLGGWQHPMAAEWTAQAPNLATAWETGFVWFDGMFIYLANNLLGVAVMMGKAMVLVVMVVVFRWTFPRLRVDQLMGVCWKYLVPLSLVCVFFTASWMLFFHQPDGSPAMVNLFGLELTVNYMAGADLEWWQNGNLFTGIGILIFLTPIVVAVRRNWRDIDFKPAYGAAR